MVYVKTIPDFLLTFVEEMTEDGTGYEFKKNLNIIKLDSYTSIVEKDDNLQWHIS